MATAEHAKHAEKEWILRKPLALALLASIRTCGRETSLDESAIAG